MFKESMIRLNIGEKVMSKVFHVRKKPITIQAMKALDVIQAKKENNLPNWLVTADQKGNLVFADDGIYVTTLEGTMFAGSEDWIMCGIKSEIYPCKADIFEQTYDIIA